MAKKNKTQESIKEVKKEATKAENQKLLNAPTKEEPVKEIPKEEIEPVKEEQTPNNVVETKVETSEAKEPQSLDRKVEEPQLIEEQKPHTVLPKQQKVAKKRMGFRGFSLFKKQNIKREKPSKQKQEIHKTQTTKRRFRMSFILVAVAYGLLISGGIIYHEKYPLGYMKTPPTNMEQNPMVLAIQNSENSKEHVFTPKTTAPDVTGKSYGIFFKDKKQGSNAEFVEVTTKNRNQILPMASITKLMTALVALDEYDLDQKVTVPAGCVNVKDGSNVGIEKDQIFSLQDLLYGLLVKSGADAGCAIANLENPTDFVQKMNRKAKKLGMFNTKFQNVIGFDAGDQQVSTIDDIKILSEEVLKNSVLRKIIGTQIIDITPQNSSTVYKFETTNDLLKTIPGTIGIKTGYTEKAGECLSYLYSDRNHEILIIILGSEKRFEDTQSLLNWAKKEIASYNPIKS